jgi:hypothetical protein
MTVQTSMHVVLAVFAALPMRLAVLPGPSLRAACSWLNMS